MSQNPVKVESLDKNRFLGDTWYVKGTAGLDYLRRQSAVLSEAGYSTAIDGAGLLYGEYLADAFVTRADMLLRQQEVYRALAEKSGPLTLYGPNDYLFPYTGVYRDTPMAGNQDIFETDSVPFLQLVLSGHMRLIAPYANENFYSRTDLLKCMEYNVYPSFLLTEEPNGALSKTTLWTTSSSQFEQWEEIIRELTGAVCEVLEPVQGSVWFAIRRLRRWCMPSPTRAARCMSTMAARPIPPAAVRRCRRKAAGSYRFRLSRERGGVA